MEPSSAYSNSYENHTLFRSVQKFVFCSMRSRDINSGRPDGTDILSVDDGRVQITRMAAYSSACVL